MDKKKKENGQTEDNRKSEEKNYKKRSCLQREVIYKEKLLDNLIRCYEE